MLTDQGREAVHSLLDHGPEGAEAHSQVAPELTQPRDSETSLLARLRARVGQSEQRPRVTIYTERGKTAGSPTLVGTHFVDIRREGGVAQLYPREAIIHIDLPWSEDV